MNNCVGRMNEESDPNRATDAPVADRVARSPLAIVARVVAASTLVTVLMVVGSLDVWPDSLRIVAISALWGAWGIVLLSVLVPSATSLTAVRLLLPAMAGLAVVRLVDGTDPGVWLGLGVALLACVLVAAAEVGEHFVQSSAYGDERRFTLRCPRPMSMVLVLSWLVWFGSIFAAMALLLGNEPGDEPSGTRIAVGIACAVVGLISSIALPRRFHRFSRRWLVYVPAGLVVHDHVALAETAMFSVRDVVRLEPVARTDEADLSAGCSGVGLAVELGDFDTVVRAATPSTPGGTAVHVRTLWVCPSRPGRAASAWAARSPRR